MKFRLISFIPFVVILAPGLALAGSTGIPFDSINDMLPWDSSDIHRPDYQQKTQPNYPKRPMRTLRQRQTFSRPINHASVDIDARLPNTSLYTRRANGTLPYDIGIRVITPEYPAMSVVGYAAGTTPSNDNRKLDLNCEIESIRRWDRDRMRGWGVRVAATFSDKDTVDMLDKAKTVVIAHGVCHPLIEKQGQLATKGVYEYHAAFVSRFEDTDKTAVALEIGTELHFNTAGNGYFQRPRIEMAFTSLNARDQVRIQHR